LKLLDLEFANSIRLTESSPQSRPSASIGQVRIRLNVSLLQWSVKKAKKVRSLSPPSGAPLRIGAVADEERSGPQFD
jgi:hypothetical protein